MPLFKVSVESQVPVSAVVVSNAPTEAEALDEVRLLQSRARVNWRRGLTPIGAIEAPYEIWAHKAANGSFTVSLYALIPISALQSMVAEDADTVTSIVEDRQSSGLIKWTYRGVPIGDYREPIPTFWSNQQPDEVTQTTCSLSTPSTFPGQSVTLSSDVSGEETPVGNLEFRDTVTGTVIVPTTLEADPVTAGLAHAQAVVVLPSGSYSVQAVYLGSDGYQTSSSAVLPLSIAKIPSLTSITPPFSPIYAGQSVTLKAVITHSTPGAAQPTGTITLFQGSTVLGSTQLISLGNSSTGGFNLGALPPGNYSFTVQYDGDAIHSGSSASISGVQVLQVPTVNVLSIIQLSSGMVTSGSTYSETVRFQALVTSGVSGTVATGTITFKEGVSVLGTAVLVPAPSFGNNVAIAFMDKSNFSVGTHSNLTASYPGNASFASSDSSPSTLLVSKADVTVNAASTNSPTVFGQAAIFDSTVGMVAPAVISPFQQYGVAGSVTYHDSGVAVVNFDGTGHAGRAVSNLPTGTNSISVSFNATAEFNSNSVSFPHQVSKADTTTHIFQFTPNPAAYYLTTSIACTVTPVAPGAGTVTGTVSFSVFDPFYWGDLFLGTGTMMGGVAGISFNWFILITDNYQYTAHYDGDANFNVSQDQQSFVGIGYYF